MANFIDISVLGDQALQKKLKRLETKVQRKIVRKAMRAAFKPVHQAAKRYAASITNPANATETALKISRGLKLRAAKARRGSFGVRVVTPTRAEMGIPPKSRWYSPAHIELGTKKVKARPYLRNPLESMKGRVIRIMRVRTWRLILSEVRAA